jgi:hypothetical protein
MTRRIRTTHWLTALTVAGGLFLAARPAQAQRNTYADWPYNQGSLFYRYIPPAKPKPVYRPAVRPAPARAATVYAQPGASTAQPRYYYNPQTRSYYYYPTQPVPTQLVQPAAPR